MVCLGFCTEGVRVSGVWTVVGLGFVGFRVCGACVSCNSRLFFGSCLTQEESRIG